MIAPGLSPSPQSLESESWETVLARVFTAAADPGPAQQRLNLRFVLLDPPATLLVTGRDGVGGVQTGEAARRGEADLTFTLRDAQAAHAFWSGALNPVAAITAGALRLDGSPLRALALAPGLGRVQAAYRQDRAARGGSAPGGDNPSVGFADSSPQRGAKS